MPTPDTFEEKKESPYEWHCTCNTITKPDGTDKQGVMCMKHVNELVAEARAQERHKIAIWVREHERTIEGPVDYDGIIDSKELLDYLKG